MSYPTWKALWEAMEAAEAPPSNPNKHRASSLPAKMTCIEYVSEGASDAATRGRCLHYIMEHGPESMPFDISDDDEHQVNIAWSGFETLMADGWTLLAKEQFAENDIVTCNMDLVLQRGNEIMYIDWKFGMGMVKDTSPQLACGAMLLHEQNPGADIFTGVIQPFFLEMSGSMGIRRWTYEQSKRVVEEAIAHKLGVSPQCQYCDRNGSCPTILKTARKYNG